MSEPKLYTVNGVLHLNSRTGYGELSVDIAYEGGDLILYVLDTDILPIDAHLESKLHEDDSPVIVEWCGINSDVYIAYEQRCKNHNVTPMSREKYIAANHIRYSLQSALSYRNKFDQDQYYVFEAIENALLIANHALLLLDPMKKQL
jgi:hypothetical protein